MGPNPSMPRRPKWASSGPDGFLRGHGSRGEPTGLFDRGMFNALEKRENHLVSPFVLTKGLR